MRSFKRKVALRLFSTDSVVSGGSYVHILKGYRAGYSWVFLFAFLEEKESPS